MIERGDPLFAQKTSRSQEIDTFFSRESKNSILEEDANHDRTGRPVVCSQSSSTFNEVDIDFRISGLPHSVVKQAENSRVRELVKKIENHPLIDKIFTPIYNKIMPTTHLVKSPRR